MNHLNEKKTICFYDDTENQIGDYFHAAESSVSSVN